MSFIHTFCARLRQYTTPCRSRGGIELWALGLLTLSLSACNIQDQLPLGTTLSISPEQRTLNIDDRTNGDGVCIINPDFYIDWPIVLALADGNGMPVGQQDVSVYVDFAANTFSGFPVMALFDDRRGNSNGVVDEFELVSDTDDDIAVVQTDLFGGDRPLILRVNVSCPFRGEVFAFVEGVSASASIDIVLRNEESQAVVNEEQGL